jgi:hypothetical protein
MRVSGAEGSSERKLTPMSNIKQLLIALREEMEESTGEAISIIGDIPPALLLADVCRALGLEDHERCEVLGKYGVTYLENVQNAPVQLTITH